MRWYGDNSELNGIWDAELPDILIFGGVSIFKEQIPRLIQIINSKKQEYSKEADFPIKYNFRDLKRWYEDRQLVDLYSRLISDSKKWRKDIIKESLEIDYNIVIACVNFHSKKAEKIKTNKENVARYAFSNALMRVALLVSDIPSANNCEVYLDWPDGRNHIPFTEEYRSAYYQGCCHDNPGIKYFSGPLRSLGFGESPYFTKMEECTLLQFSDLVIGATREFVYYCMGKRSDRHLGVQLTKYLVPKFRGYPRRIIGRGISIAPTGGNLRSLLFKGMLKLRQSDN